MAPSPVTKDPDAARELQERYGVTGNAEALVRANALRFDAALRASQNLPRDKEATEKLSASKVASLATVEEDQIHDYSVRGPYLVVAYEDSSGRVQKRAVRYEGDPSDEETAEVKDREVLHAEVRLAQAQREARADADEVVAKAKAEADQKAADISAKAAQEAQEDIKKVAARNEKEAAKEEAASAE
jgi:hypothetical protein